MGDNVEDVSGLRVDDRKSVDPVVQQRPDGVEETRVGPDGDEVLHVVENVWNETKLQAWEEFSQTPGEKNSAKLPI